MFRNIRDRFFFFPDFRNSTLIRQYSPTFWLAMVVLGALLSSWPLFSSSIVFGHDMIFHTARIEGIKEGLLGGQFPVKIYGHFFFEYGYPSGIFYPDLFLYIPAFLRIAGFSMLVSYHSFCLLINLITSLLAWWSFTQFFRFLLPDETNKNPSLGFAYGAISSIIYTGFLYRLVDMYSRSAIGEALAMTFLPLALISFWLMIHHSTKYWIMVVIGCTGIIESHLLSTVMIVSIMFLLSIVSAKKFFRKPVLLAVGKAALFTTLINLWFLVPFWDFNRYYDFHMKHLPSNISVLGDTALSWDFIFAVYGFVGPVAILLLLGFLFSRIWKKWNGSDIEKKRIVVYFYVVLAVGILSIVAMSTSFPWKLLSAVPLLKHMGIIQFPFRLCMFAAVAFTLGMTISMAGFIKRARCVPCEIFLCLMVTVSNLILLHPSDPSGKLSWQIIHENEFLNLIFENRDASGSKLSESRTAASTYMDYIYDDIIDADVREHPLDLASMDSWGADAWLEICNDGNNVLDVYDVQPAEAITESSRKGTSFTFVSNSDTSVDVILPMFYYPGYEARTTDGKNLPVSSVGKHRLQVSVPAGTNEVTIQYAGKTFWRISYFISLLSLIVFIVYAKRLIREVLC